MSQPLAVRRGKRVNILRPERYRDDAEGGSPVDTSSSPHAAPKRPRGHPCLPASSPPSHPPASDSEQGGADPQHVQEDDCHDREAGEPMVDEHGEAAVVDVEDAVAMEQNVITPATSKVQRHTVTTMSV
jgi:hypothetical protein